MNVIRRLASLFQKRDTKSVSSAVSSTKKHQHLNKYQISQRTQRLGSQGLRSKILGMFKSPLNTKSWDALESYRLPSSLQPGRLSIRARRRKRGNAKNFESPLANTTSAEHEYKGQVEGFPVFKCPLQGGALSNATQREDAKGSCDSCGNEVQVPKIKPEVHKPWNNPKGHRKPYIATDEERTGWTPAEVKAEQIRRTIG